MSRFTNDLLGWFDKDSRTMPWREQKNPYKIWLSEIMLQQTQVATVKPYFNRWVKKFPTLKHVAKAKEESILKSWEGLGYYSRARNFQTACRQVMTEYGGQIPQTADELIKLKGIGPYTAAAISSIAFSNPAIAIDGNIKRVVARINAFRKPPSQMMSKIELFLKKNISHEKPGDFNEALMDLGATVCIPSQPKCDVCPVKRHCIAYAKKKTHLIPAREKKIIRPHYRIAVGVVWKKDKILVSKRKPTGLLAGLWEFPGGKIKPKESAQKCARREIKEEVGIDVKVGGHIGKIKHAFTHFSIEMDAYHCKYIKGKPRAIECSDVRWVGMKEIKVLAFPKANHKLFALIQKKNPFLADQRSH